MTEINLAFKAYDVHELGCHFVARHAGLYERHSLQPRLIDATFIADDALPPHSFLAACGSALAAWLQGADTRVVFVATDRPMFWLYGRPELRGLADLEGELVAGYPPAAPPAVFLREVWASHGLAPDRLQVRAARDDVARVGLLRDGGAAAALISSAVPPGVMQAFGFEPLMFLGDEIRVATTGLAASPSLCKGERDLVAALCACYSEALALIHQDTAIVEAALRSGVVSIGSDVASLAVVLRRCYTQDGESPAERLQQGADRMARAMGIEGARSVSGLYDFSFLGQ